MSVKDIIILGCSSQQPTRSRNHGAYLVRWNGEGLLFDPGEGTQRQFIFADIAPTCVNRIFFSHFHGDHCLGLGSMLMRLNLDKVTHPVKCYFPASGKKNFDSLRYGCIYHQTIDTLSKGYQRRVGLAQALIHDPQVLILDEPTDGLDPNQKHEVRGLIKKMAKDKCIIISTHILEEVESVCSRTIIIAKGRILTDSTPEKLKKKYDCSLEEVFRRITGKKTA